MILVTGGTGLVGSHLLFSLLKEGKRVRALKRESSNLNNVLKVFSYYDDNAQLLFDKIEWNDVDLSDITDLKRVFDDVEEVFHCAAMISFYPQDASKMIRYNPLITANLVNASLEFRVKKFCFVSSVAALSKRKNELTNESNIWKDDPDNTSYAISKYLSEMEVWRGVEEGLKAVIVNPCFILGPGNWSATTSTFFDRSYKGMRYYTEGTNAFVDVQDVVKVMVELMEKQMFGQRFILSSENWKFKDFFTRVAKEFGVKAPYIKPSKWMISIIWRAEWLRSRLFNTKPFITKESAKSAQNLISYDSGRIREAIDFQFRPVEESIKEYCQYYLDDLKV